MTIHRCTMRLAFALAIGVALAAVGLAPALAAQATGTMRVSATIPAVCNLKTNPLNFGNYDPAAPGIHQAKTTTDVTCSKGAPWVVEYDNGQWSAGDCFTRRLADPGGTAFLTYMLFNGGATVPQNEPLGLRAQAPKCFQHGDTGTGALQQPVVLGEIGPGQTEPNGTYTDTIVVTLHF